MKFSWLIKIQLITSYLSLNSHLSILLLCRFGFVIRQHPPPPLVFSSPHFLPLFVKY